MANPSIKGAAFVSVVEDVAKAIDAGHLDRSELERKLTPRVLELLDETIQTALWYPVDAYRELTELLVASVGGGDLRYMFERGVATAERMIEAGLYRQMQFANEQAGGARENCEATARLIVTIAPAMFNFTKWSIETNPDVNDGFTVRIVEAQDFPEVLQHSAAGFSHTVAERAVGRLKQTCRRISPAEIKMVHRYID